MENDSFALLIINSSVGAFMILIGFLVKKYPNLIAGYNTMSASEKQKVDIEGLSTMMRNGLIFIGVSLITTYPIMMMIELDQYNDYIMPSIIILGVTVMVIYAQTFKKN